MRIRSCLFLLYVSFLLGKLVRFSHGQDGGGDKEGDAPPPPGLDTCNGVYLSYSLTSREKEYPYVKNVSAQAWAFSAVATVANVGTEEVKSWKMFVGFQHREVLVSATNAVLVDGSGDFPADVGNGTVFTGSPMADLPTSIDTAGDWKQISVQMELKGTMFGMAVKATPMPKKIELVNDGWTCPKSTRKDNYMYVCCKKDPRFKTKQLKTKFQARRSGDLNIMYDVLQSYGNSYLAQVTMDNNNPIGRLDHWNLTWQWMRGEFIYSMRGAFTSRTDFASCLYGVQSHYYPDLDYSQVLNCQKTPVISDLPRERSNDSNVGRIPFCCRDGSLLPSHMDASKSRAAFQLKVFKIPPDMNRTALYPPQKWNITGLLNPTYKCGPPVRVEPTEFPDPTGLRATTIAVASWQIICHISKPKTTKPKCCVSFSAYYNSSVVPCRTCACGCDDVDSDTCNPNARAMLLPPSAMLVPFENRTAKARAWAGLHHWHIPKKMPCPDNCGVSINWHINSDYSNGWTARITIFNWGKHAFDDWFTAVTMDKAYNGFDRVYSFNGTKLDDNKVKNTLFFQGLPGLNYLIEMTNGTDSQRGLRVPGKQQSVIAFSKKNTKGIQIKRGDGFPTRVFFDGEECALPGQIPVARAVKVGVGAVPGLVATVAIAFLLVTDRLR